MANKRKAIRQKIKELLTADNNFTGVTIFSSRQNPVVLNQQLPSITVFVSNEPVEPESMDERRYIRTPEILFEARVFATDNVDDDLDDLMTKIENFMVTNSFIEGLVLNTLQITSESEVGIEGTKEIGLGTVTFTAQYIT